MINNDNLANVLGAAAAFLAVYVVVRPLPKNRELWVCAALGVVAGAMVLTKFSTLFLLPGIALALWLAASRDRVRTCARRATRELRSPGPTLAVCGWWLYLNTAWYGDPIANRAALDHSDVAPILVAHSGSLEAVFVDLPNNAWRNFWYSSGWNQFRWSAWSSLPLWADSPSASLASLAVNETRKATVPTGRCLGARPHGAGRAGRPVRDRHRAERERGPRRHP